VSKRAVLMMVMGAVLVSGCEGPMFEGSIFEQPARKDPDMARIATNTQQMSLEFRQLAEQVEALNRRQEAQDGRLSRLEAQVSAESRTQDDLVGVRRDIQLIRAERETLKKEITDDLASRVEKIAARQQAEIRSARPATATTATSVAPASAKRAAGTVAGRTGYEHKVEKGQTLSVIAKGYGTTVDAILKANKLANPSAIRVGQVLFIPE